MALVKMAFAVLTKYEKTGDKLAEFLAKLKVESDHETLKQDPNYSVLLN